MNKEYWQEFYKNDLEPNNGSSFSKFVLSHLDPHEQLLDLGCGNGKDTYYFLKNQIRAIGIDNNEFLSKEHFIIGDVLQNLQKCQNYYLRFFIHAIEEEYFDCILEEVHRISDKGTKVFIETRSTEGITQEDKLLHNFKSGVGEEHFRMLYNCSYLEEKIEKKFSIFHLEESYGLSPFNGRDPCLIRICCVKE
tara:strand:- start:2118 stop:2696 length:579 start_codon:yes stop_codon:yes gene_type:complete